MQLRTELTIPDCCVRCLKTFRAHHHRLLRPPSLSPMLCVVPPPQSATAEKPTTYYTIAMSRTPPLESCRRPTEVLRSTRFGSTAAVKAMSFGRGQTAMSTAAAAEWADGKNGSVDFSRGEGEARV
nr:hypothetical protein Itr_chr07CG11860 [Ipomoea trifida]